MAIRYVSLSGNDSNAGTIGSPYRTIAKGLSQTVAGDTLYIRGGTYNERISSQAQSIPRGTGWTNAVTIAAYPSETVTLKPTSSGQAVIYLLYSSYQMHYIIFDGLIIDGSVTAQTFGISLDGYNYNTNIHHIRFNNCEVKNTRLSGVLTGRGANFLEFINTDAHHCGHDTQYDHGFYLQSSDCVVNGGEFYNNASCGIQIYTGLPNDSCNRNVVKNARFHHNENGLILGSGDNNQGYNNLVYENSEEGIKTGFSNGKNTKIYHNTIYSNGGNGIEVRSGITGVRVINNIAYQNGTDLLDLGAGTEKTTNWLTSNGNPLFTNAGAGDFTLQAGSPCRDAGTALSTVPTDFAGNVRPNGSAWDIGAYEYGGVVAPPPPPPPETVPTAPSGLSVSVLSSSQLRPSWTDNSSNESGFKIERGLSSSGPWQEITTVGANVVSYTDSGLTAATTYSYRVRATNAAGESAYTSVASATTAAAPGVVPTAPSSLNATAVSAGRIDVTWTDNSSNESSFKLERAPAPGTVWAQIATTAPGVTTYINTGLAASTQYFYRVRASNSVGDSAYSNTDDATTAAPPGAIPTAPSDLTVTVISYTQLDLAWTDNSSDEDGFQIERSIDGVSFAQIAVVDDGVVTYSDLGLSPLSTYFYRVRAFNATGNSAYANVTNATTVALAAQIFDSNQMRSLLGLAPIPDLLIGTGPDERHLLFLYRGPFANAIAAILGPLRTGMQFITLVDLSLDYGTFYYANYYDDRVTTYVPRLIGHGTITEELPDLFNTTLGRRNASVRFSPVETGDIEAPTLAYHAATEDLYSQHALVRIYDLGDEGTDIIVGDRNIMALNAPITSYDIASGDLQIEDDADAIFDTLIPKVRLREIYPTIDLSTGRGQDPPVIIPFGTMRKVPLYLVEVTDEDVYSNQQWRYGAWRKPLTGTITVATVYRDGQVVDSTQYTIIENPDGYYNVAFFLDQRDTGGRPLPILADLVSSEFNHSPALALDFLLSDNTYGLGQEVNAASIEQAELDYLGVSERIGGGLWQQVIAKSVVPLVLLHGAWITRNDGNEWFLYIDTLDKHNQPEDSALQLGLGDDAGWQNITAVTPQHRRVNERYKQLTVKGVWDPDFSGSGSWLVTSDRTRGVAGTVKVVENPFIPDAGTVDRECDYLFTRYAAQDRSLAVQTTTEAYVLSLGTLVKVNIPNYHLNEQLFEVRAKTFVGDQSTAFALTLYGWDYHAFDYVPGDPIILPRANVLSDFRRTPPDEPTGFQVNGYDVRTGEEGIVQSLVQLTAFAPADNVTHLVFATYREGSGVIRSMVQVAVVEDDLNTNAELPVTPGLTYDYECWALNVNNDSDRNESTHAQILNQLATGDLDPPLPPTGLVATAQVGRTVSLDWNDNTEDDFKTYVVYRCLDATFSNDYNVDTVGEVRASRMVDQHEIEYDTFYYYRVKAKDMSGNLSEWSNTSVAYVHHLTAHDPGEHTIHTPHRQPFNAVVASVSIPAHQSLSFDTGLNTETGEYTGGCLGVQATDEWTSFTGSNGTRLFELIASGPIPGGFDANYHVGMWNGVNATWNTSVKIRGW